MATESEKRTPVFDYMAGDFKYDSLGRIQTVTEGEALEQIAIKALQTARSLYLIYFDNEDPDKHDKYGSEVADILTRRDLPESTRISELQRAIREALIYDPWVLEVYEVNVRRKGADEVEADLKIRTIFDREVILQGVNI